MPAAQIYHQLGEVRSEQAVLETIRRKFPEFLP